MTTGEQMRRAETLLKLDVAELLHDGVNEFAIAACLSNLAGEVWARLVPDGQSCL